LQLVEKQGGEAAADLGLAHQQAERELPLDRHVLGARAGVGADEQQHLSEVAAHHQGCVVGGELRQEVVQFGSV
jgi:hypothetical protein